LTESPKEVICAWPLEHENVADAALNINWNYIVGLFDLLELRVDKGFI